MHYPSSSELNVILAFHSCAATGVQDELAEAKPGDYLYF